MIAQAKIKNLLKYVGPSSAKGYLPKTAYVALLVSFTFIADAHASQRRSLLDEGFGRGPLQKIEACPHRSQGGYWANTKRGAPIYRLRENFNTPFSQMQVSSPLPTLGLMETPREIVGHHYSPAPEISPFPYSFQLSMRNEFYSSAVGNQLQLGTCASFAVVDGLLYAHGKSLSPAYLNVKAKSQYARDCSNNGLNIGIAMRCALDYGTVMDWLWSYKGYYAEVEKANKSISNEPQPNWNVCAKSPYTEMQDKGLVKFAFENIQSLFLNNARDGKDLLIKDALIAYKAPVIISVPVQWNHEWRPDFQTTGEIKTSPQSIDGWHAISICGFNERTQTFTFKNSWGLKWGKQGFGTMTYSYVIHHAREAWVGYGTQLKS
jgi:hypothetical protein